MRILIAEDSAVSRELLVATLEGFGHEVVAVKDGVAALEALLAPDGPHLAILDWMMPGLDGLEVCRQVRWRATHYVYLILLTACDRHENMLAALDAGADEFLTKPFKAAVLRARLRSGARILRLEANLRSAQNLLLEQATRDHLTGLWNRRVVLDRLEKERAQVEREGRPLAIVLADLDRFKSINDTQGHAAGDAVLRQAAKRMQGQLRDCDSIGRYGGEEFLIVLPGCDLAAASQIAERIRAAIAGDPMRHGEVLLPVTVSLGVVSTLLSGDTASLIHFADEALYRAKAGGRNRVEAASFGVAGLAAPAAGGTPAWPRQMVQ
jgi:diguanylate cyclase (GGDEF)-like protein